ncbi:MAG: hypothetical protein LBO09_02430 [Candidatus Peribacteria bacterium]|nr:hypothetical protein [Candidatus Peribacteria bacterium]
MNNFPVFDCQREEISSKERNFLVDASAVSRFPSEMISRFWKSERGSQESFFVCFNSDPCEGLRSEFFNDFFIGEINGSKGVRKKRGDDVELFFVEEKVDPMKFLSSRLAMGESGSSFLDLRGAEISSDIEVISELEKLGRVESPFSWGNTISIFSISSRRGGDGMERNSLLTFLHHGFNFFVDIFHTL